MTFVIRCQLNGYALIFTFSLRMALAVGLLSYLYDWKVILALTAITVGTYVKNSTNKLKRIPGPPRWPIVGSTPCKNTVSIIFLSCLCTRVNSH